MLLYFILEYRSNTVIYLIITTNQVSDKRK